MTDRSPPGPQGGSSRAARLAPGVVLCLAVALFAILSQGLETRLFGRAWLEGLVIAILAGTAIRSVWTPAPALQAGIDFSARTLLEFAVVLLGASVSAATILSVGPGLLAGTVAVVAVAIGVSYGLGRLFRLPHRMAVLIACGNSICGNSAIAAVAPIIEADGDEVSASIAFTAILGVAVVLILPLIGALLHITELQYGALAGLTVYAVPQVIAATAPVGLVATQVGTLVKLVRVLTLGPVCVVLSILTALRRDGRARSAGSAPVEGRSQLSIRRLVPWFIVGFLLMVLARSLNLIPAVALTPIGHAAGILTVISMAALGLSTDVRVVARSGVRVSVVVTLSLLALAAISLGLIVLLGI